MKIKRFWITMLALMGASAISVSNVYAQKKQNTQGEPTGGVDKTKIICEKFCSVPADINYKKTDYSEGLNKKLGELKLDELANNLAKGAYSPNQIPSALQYLALRLMQDNKVDDSIKIYQCAAQNYYEMVSMYRMARFYKRGTESIKEDHPGVIIKNEIKPDFKKAYFWVAALMYVELAEKTGLLSSGTQLGWSATAMLDDLQNTDKLSEEEMIRIEGDARKFIGKRYPEVLNEQLGNQP